MPQHGGSVQQGFREPTPGLRQSPGRAVRASWTASWAWRSLIRAGAIAILFGLFLAFVGVGTAVQGGFAMRAGYLTTISLIGVTIAISLWRLLEQRAALANRRWLIAILVGLIQAPVMAAVVWVGDAVALHRSLAMDEFPGYLLISVGVSLFMNLIVFLVSRERVVTVPAPITEVRFLERLPAKLRGAQVWAVEAEDHYLRLHTSKGQDLILLRLADAVAELDGIEGLQVHRSWWVARDAIADIARGDGRATLTLQDGSQVPVSRTYAKVLREKGWM